jgi:hypothetical protein
MYDVDTVLNEAEAEKTVQQVLQYEFARFAFFTIILSFANRLVIKK